MPILDKITETQMWKSIFRHPMPTDRRNRVVVMLTNFFLHLHPVSVRKQGIALSYTWCMGGTTFFLFIVEVVTGVLLMFYYRPTLEHAYNDILALRDVTTLGIMRELHRWGAHAMVIAVWLHMYRVFLTGSYKPPREFNWVIGVLLLGDDASALVHRLFAPVGPTGDLGHHRWLQHGAGHARRGRRGAWGVAPGAQRGEADHLGLGREIRPAGRTGRGRDDAQPVLRASLRGHSAGGRAPDHDSLLAGSQGWRHQWADVSTVRGVAGRSRRRARARPRVRS